MERTTKSAGDSASLAATRKPTGSGAPVPQPLACPALPMSAPPLAPRHEARLIREAARAGRLA